MSQELMITLSILVVELALLGFCYMKATQPVDPARPRLIPYTLVMLLLALVFLATLAHVISLLTGHQIQPMRKKGL